MIRASERDAGTRAAFAAQQTMLDMDMIVVLDESSTNIAFTPHYGWAESTKRAYGDAPRNHGKNVTVLTALTTQGIRTPATITYRGGTKKATFEAYVEHQLCPVLIAGQSVVMDNLSAHRTTRVRALIEARQCTVVYLPAYSPDFSPIEFAFSKLKRILRKMAARTYDALDTAITAALATITVTDAQHWFKHCGFTKPDQSFCELL